MSDADAKDGRAGVTNGKPICELKCTVLTADGEVSVEGTATTYTMPLDGL